MTEKQLVSVFYETHPTNNHRCDGEHCKESNGVVRIIPLDDSYNVNLCQSCYRHEMIYNEDLELDGLERVLPDLPFCVYPVNHETK